MNALIALLDKLPQPVYNATFRVFVDMARSLVNGGSFSDAVEAAKDSALALDNIKAVYDERAAAKFPGFVAGAKK